MPRYGILGGTFNPIHFGHLILAERAREELHLDKVFFIPSSLPPHKKIEDGGIMPLPEERLRMVQMAVEDEPNFEVLDVEVRRGGVSYTIDTVRWIYREIKPDELFVIIGADLVAGLESWKEFEELVEMVVFGVAAREGIIPPLPPNARINTFFCPRIDISSSLVRRLVRKGKSIRYLVPEAVRLEIEKKGYYRW